MEREIKVLHLYPKALDLYGDSANLKAIDFALKKMGGKLSVTECELWDEMPNLDEFDMVYIGHGKVKNLVPVAEKIVKYKDQIVDAIEGGKLFFVTGNARELFGNSFENAEKKEIPALGLFPYKAKETGEVIVSDEIGTVTFGENTFTTYGFINRTAHLVGCETEPFFKLSRGISDGEEKRGQEGTHYKNFFGTWQVGPLLVRNPLLLKEFLKLLLGSDFVDFDTALEEKALEATLEEFNHTKQAKA